MQFRPAPCTVVSFIRFHRRCFLVFVSCVPCLSVSNLSAFSYPLLSTSLVGHRDTIIRALTNRIDQLDEETKIAKERNRTSEDTQTKQDIQEREMSVAHLSSALCLGRTFYS